MRENIAKSLGATFLTHTVALKMRLVTMYVIVPHF